MYKVKLNLPFDKYFNTAFKDYLKGSLNFGFFFNDIEREVAKMKRGKFK
jgi:hypothetical protein